jgi:hypothetical protein
MALDELIIKMLRAAAWERAKGELNALRHTFNSQMDHGTILVEAGKLDMFDELMADFVKRVEDNELHY